MKQILLIILLFYPCSGKKETLDDLSSILNDPELLYELRKRFGKLLDDTTDDDDFTDTDVGCYALAGTLNGDCNFHTNASTIIKTTESIGKGARFVENVANVSCARNCTKECCLNDDCDTAVYQDKAEHNCYLFHCGKPSKCVFVHHGDYWMSSSSKEVHKSHQYTPGGATHSHENELVNLGTHNPDDGKSSVTTEPHIKTTKATHSTTVPITTPKPGLGESCPSYEAECSDPHAECLMQICRCRVGYHQKHNVCRKHCRDEEFECENIEYKPRAMQCVGSSYVCDGNEDCQDGSDEVDCPSLKVDKTAYEDSDSSSKLYNNPLYNTPLGNQPDTQYPYGFPIAGLASQQQAALLQPNQIYPSQVQPNGQYYFPNLANPIPQTGAQLSPQQWPFIDKSIGINPQLLPNTIPGYQTAQQSGYLSPQAANYVPVVQSPLQSPVKINPNVQPVQIVPNQNVNPVLQQSALINPVAMGPVSGVQPGSKLTKIAQEKGQDHNEMNKVIPVDVLSTPLPTIQNKDRYSSETKFVNTDDTVESRNEYYDEATVRQTGLPMFDDDMVDVDAQKIPQNTNTDGGSKDSEAERQSQDTDDHFYKKPKTFPPSTKAKAQIASPTQSTASGQRQSQTHSEGFPDYSWVKYDSDSPKVSGKKGMSVLNDKHDTYVKAGAKQRAKPHMPLENSLSGKHGVARKPSEGNHAGKPKTANRLLPSTRYNDRTSDGSYDYESDKYPGRYVENYPRPSNSHRPLYDRYGDRYNDNRRRPGHGSHYPYYDTGYVRGRDRNPYPSWDKFSDEYYYPDSFDGNNVDLKQDITYEDIPETSQHESGTYNEDVSKDKQPTTVKSTPTDVIMKTSSTTGQFKDILPTSTIPTVTKVVLNPNADHSNVDQGPEQSSDSQDADQDMDASKEDSKEIENKPADEESDNKTALSQDMSDADKPFRILNADKIEVDTYTDSSQGPIVALALGLAITMMLLIFVGCRLRTVKRRLRKGRALHSNEADYLINGMYL